MDIITIALLIVIILLLVRNEMTQYFLIKKIRNIMTKQEFADAISAVSDTLQKALTEVTTELANLDNSSPAMDAALTRLQAAAKALDDLNPDAAPPTT